MALRKPDAPTLVILDWMMPGMDGLEICRRVREVGRQLYVILLTARGGKENLIEGLAAGADDYLVKPFDKEELQARILVGLRVMAMQSALAVGSRRSKHTARPDATCLPPEIAKRHGLLASWLRLGFPLYLQPRQCGGDLFATAPYGYPRSPALIPPSSSSSPIAGSPSWWPIIATIMLRTFAKP